MASPVPPVISFYGSQYLSNALIFPGGSLKAKNGPTPYPSDDCSEDANCLFCFLKARSCECNLYNQECQFFYKSLNWCVTSCPLFTYISRIYGAAHFDRNHFKTLPAFDTSTIFHFKRLLYLSLHSCTCAYHLIICRPILMHLQAHSVPTSPALLQAQVVTPLLHLQNAM